MFIFIVQHGDALSSEENPERPLSEKGIEQTRIMSKFLSVNSLIPDIIVHSGKERAKETAEIVSTALGKIKHECRDFLNPKDDPSKIIEEIKDIDKSIMIVGHLPFLEHLASKLLCLGGNEKIVDIKNTSPLILKRVDGAYIIHSYILNEHI